MKLVIEDDAGTRSIVPFSSDELVIGRGTEGVGWRLPDRNVSRRHARFLRVNGVIYVEDLDSLTGTRVNGERIQGRRRVREGDLVGIGDYDVALLPDPAITAGPATPPPIRTTPAPSPVPSGRAAPAARPEPGARTRAERSVLPAPGPSAPRPPRRRPGPDERTALTVHAPGTTDAAIATAPAPRARGGRLAAAAVCAAASALLGLAAGYLAGWLGLL